MKLGSSLHRVGSELVASYLVEEAGALTLIDAGIPGQWPDLEDEVAAMGRTLADIRGVVLTHADTDHIGMAERLRREHGVRSYAHELEAARARGEDSKKVGTGPIKPGPFLRFLWYAGRRGGLRVPPITEVETFVDGAVLDLPGAPRIIHVPGHTPGSVAVHVPAADALFVGDAMTTGHVLTGSKGPQPAPFTLDPAQALDSLRRLEGVSATWILPGHGAPWRGGLTEALRLVREGAA